MQRIKKKDVEKIHIQRGAKFIIKHQSCHLVKNIVNCLSERVDNVRDKNGNHQGNS